VENVRREKLNEGEVKELIADLNGWQFENDQIKPTVNFQISLLHWRS
jgi:pterin-4a-carbinolamine dehydratase